MFSKSNETKSRIETVIGSNTDLEGNVHTTESLRIDGRIKGEVSADTIVIGEGGVILGDVSAAKVTVGGKVKGNIAASTLLELLPHGQILGDIKTSKLIISDGATFEGNCQMVKGEGQILELNPQVLNGELQEGSHKNLKVIAANGKR